MRMPAHALLSASAVLASLVVFLGQRGIARAQTATDACVTAYELGQTLRTEGKLKLAREQFLACAQDACPDFIRADCLRWGSEIEPSLPSVVVQARDRNGQETTEVRVLVDGIVLLERLDGRAVSVDPGAHVFRYEALGAKPIEERVVVLEGEKHRKLTVSFAPEPEPVTTPVVQPAAARHPEPVHRLQSEASSSALPYALGGVGLAGIGAFALFGSLGLSDRSALVDKNCSPNCSDDDVAPAQTKFIIADVSLVVGVVSLGVATYLFLRQPTNAKTSAKATTAAMPPAPRRLPSRPWSAADVFRF